MHAYIIQENNLTHTE